MLTLILPLIIVLVLDINGANSTRITREKHEESKTFSSCFEEIGCVDFNEKWFHIKYRPKNLQPLDRHTIRTEFLLLKPPKNLSHDLLYDVMTLKRESVEISGFKKGTCSIFVIHDFTSNGYTGWIKHLVVAFTKKTDCNIISVDWQAGAEPPYEQAISNARVVALETKAFIDTLKGCFKQSPDNLHFIGHGLGAHIAGYVGKYVPGLQRITGLDPTGHAFVHMPPEVRLDAYDAKYVEVLHTDSFNHRSQGTKTPFGHVDFIINDADHQPGCNDSSHMPSFTDLHRDTMLEGKILPACSHKRSFKYYIESLEDDECQFIGIKCVNYKSFIEGKCNSCYPKNGQSQCATFGLEPPCSITRNNTYYLLTNSKKPFCMVTYGINITVVSDSVIKELEGYFEFILVDENDRVTNATTNTNNKIIRRFDSGHRYGFILYAVPPAINRIKEAKVKWVYHSKKICIMCDKSVPVKDIAIKKLSVKNDDSNVFNLICPATKGTDLKTGDYVQFVTCESLYGPDYLKNGHQAVPDKHHGAHPSICDEAEKLAAKNATAKAKNKPEKRLSKLEHEPTTKIARHHFSPVTSTGFTVSLKRSGDKEVKKFKD